MWIRCVKWVRLSVIMTDASLPFEVRHSPIQGFGGYATRPIAAGTRLVEYAGERLTPEAAEARESVGVDPMSAERYDDEFGVRNSLLPGLRTSQARVMFQGHS